MAALFSWLTGDPFVLSVVVVEEVAKYHLKLKAALLLNCYTLCLRFSNNLRLWYFALSMCLQQLGLPEFSHCAFEPRGLACVVCVCGRCTAAPAGLLFRHQRSQTSERCGSKQTH